MVAKRLRQLIQHYTEQQRADWELEGYPFPEDPGYASWASAFYHYEALDSAPVTP